MATTGRTSWRVAIICVIVVALAALLWAAGATGGERPLRAAVRSGSFVRLGLIVVGSLVVLAAIGAILLRSGRPGRQGRATGLGVDRDGTAMLEFALLFPLAMGVVLIMVQAMLMMSATVLVNYAAYAAARTAIVWIPQDLAADPMDHWAEPANTVVAPPNSAKIAKINASAAVACLPISGTAQGGATGAPAVRAGIERYFQQMSAQPPNWVANLVDGQFAYAWSHTRVQLDGWTGNPTTYGQDQDITVWVYHDYNLSIPFASALFAQTRSSDGYLSTISASCTLNNEGVSDVIKEDKFN